MNVHSNEKLGPTKTALIREALTLHSDLGPKPIADMLTDRGVEVSAAYVSNIKSAMNGELTCSARRLGLNRHPIELAVELVLELGADEAHRFVDSAIAVIERIKSFRP